MQVDREVDETGGVRWGSGEIRITEVEMLDMDDKPQTLLRTGRPLRIRMHYEASEDIVEPGFGVAINTLDGFHVTGPNSLDVDCIPPLVRGTGFVDVEFDSLALLPGTYDMSVGVCDRTKFHSYDHRQNVIRFDVERGSIHEQYGVVSITPRWRIDPA